MITKNKKGQFDQRPESYIIEYTRKLQVDIVNLAVAVRDQAASTEGRVYHSDHEITGMASEMCVALARGLKDILDYTRAYAIKQYTQDEKDK